MAEITKFRKNCEKDENGKMVKIDKHCKNSKNAKIS